MMVVLLGLLINWAGKFRLIRLIMVAIGVLLITVVLQIQPFNRYLAAASQRLIWGMQSETLQQDGSTQWRVIETGYAVQSVLEHPLLGVGLGNFYRPAQKMDVEIGGYGIRWYIHNSYLWVLIDMGVIGFIPFILLYGIALIRGFKYWNRVSDPMFSVILLGGSLGIFGQAIGNVVAPNFFQSWMVIVFVATMAINELIIKWEFSPSKVLE
jgi:O-antigen ligase